jgi:hypothetical protein
MENTKEAIIYQALFLFSDIYAKKKINIISYPPK